jgi:3-hydroxyacyl-CoA dehydrogenase/kynurenine formamidase
MLTGSEPARYAGSHGGGFSRAAVVGAGLMGRGIAVVLAAGGLDVILCDVDPDVLGPAVAEARSAAGAAAGHGQITGVEELHTAVGDADLVVEAVVEILSVKQEVVRQVSAAVPEAVIATNTSVLPVTAVAEQASDPSRVIGAHWWNPPDLMPIVEVVPGLRTARDVTSRVTALLARLGKTPVPVRRDVPGFIGNRLQHALWREAIALVADGICDADTVDLVARNTIGLRLARMGPLENADYVGLDLTADIHDAILPSLSTEGAPSPLLRDLVQRGQLGAKTGQGFLLWGPGERDTAKRELAGHVLAQAPSRAARCCVPRRSLAPPRRPAASPGAVGRRPSPRQQTAERSLSMTFPWPSGPNEAGLEFYDLSHPWGHGVPAWPYFEDVKIERLHGMAKSRVLTQKITTVMHSGTHIDAPGHVVEGAPLLHEIPLSAFFGTGVVMSIPKQKWDVITPDDLDAARPEIRPGDIVIVNTGWHHYYADSAQYYAYSPGFYKEAGEWFAARGVKAVGTDTQALDHPLATAIGPHGPAEAQGGLLPWAVAEYEAETGRKACDDFAEWEPCHRAILSQGIYGFENVGGDLDKVTGIRVTFAAFPWRWVGGDGCIVRLVAITDPGGSYRLEPGRGA